MLVRILASIGRKLSAILAVRRYRQMAIAIGAAYLVAFLIALGDISAGGQGFEYRSTDWARMFERSGPITFEPIGMLTLRGSRFFSRRST